MKCSGNPDWYHCDVHNKSVLFDLHHTVLFKRDDVGGNVFGESASPNLLLHPRRMETLLQSYQEEK